MINFNEDAELELDTDYNERKVVRKVQKPLIGDAKQKLASNNSIRRTTSFIDLLEWFDETFQFTTN